MEISSSYNRDLPASAMVGHGKLRYFFRNASQEQIEQMVLDEEAMYSVTESRSADAMTALLRCFVKETEPILDGTACVGGNTYSLQRSFHNVFAIELDLDRLRMLRHNLRILGCDKYVCTRQADVTKFATYGIWGLSAHDSQGNCSERSFRSEDLPNTEKTDVSDFAPVNHLEDRAQLPGDQNSCPLATSDLIETSHNEKRKPVDPIESDHTRKRAFLLEAQEFQKSEKSTVKSASNNLSDNLWPSMFGAIVVDPPWGGPEYIAQKEIDVFLSELSLAAFVQLAAKRSRVVMCKVPGNYDIDAMFCSMLDMVFRSHEGPTPIQIIHAKLEKFDVIIVKFDNHESKWHEILKVADITGSLNELFPEWRQSIALLSTYEIGWRCVETEKNRNVRRKTHKF
eukprot:gene8924-1266_t